MRNCLFSPLALKRKARRDKHETKAIEESHSDVSDVKVLFLAQNSTDFRNFIFDPLIIYVFYQWRN